ncbi:MAG: ABC transporter permease [Actinomycetota bacterium]
MIRGLASVAAAQELKPPTLWQWVGDHMGLILSRTGQHVELVVIAVVVGFAISMPLSILAYRRPNVYPPVTWFTGLLYTIPFIALAVLLIPFTGLSVTTVEIGLVSYTLLILIRNIVVGLRGVPEDVKEAATGMGYTRRQLLWRVELPLALPAIMAGLRVTTVSTVGLVTIGFIIGKGALGELIIDGLDRFFTPEVLVGAVMSIALALVADVLLLLLLRLLTPWTRGRARLLPNVSRTAGA